VMPGFDKSPQAFRIGCGGRGGGGAIGADKATQIKTLRGRFGDDIFF